MEGKIELVYNDILFGRRSIGLIKRWLISNISLSGLFNTWTLNQFRRTYLET